MSEYLTTVELSKRIKMAPGTIRNLVWKKELREHVHYLKPTPRKLIFIWEKVEEWLHCKSTDDQLDTEIRANSLINI